MIDDRPMRQNDVARPIGIDPESGRIRLRERLRTSLLQREAHG